MKSGAEAGLLEEDANVMDTSGETKWARTDEQSNNNGRNMTFSSNSGLS